MTNEENSSVVWSSFGDFRQAILPNRLIFDGETCIPVLYEESRAYTPCAGMSANLDPRLPESERGASTCLRA